MKKFFAWFASILAVLIFAIVIFALVRTRDHHPDYDLDLTLESPSQENGFKAGLAKVTITPDIIDSWYDADGDSRFNPDKGDSVIDNNGNGKFDAYWMAGFSNNHPIQGVHDDIWARSVYWENGDMGVAYVVLDAIGFFHDDVIELREMIKTENPDIDHVIVSSTHNHEVPDLMGLWGPTIFKTGVNDEYKQFVKEQAVKAVTLAKQQAVPAYLKLAKIDSTGDDLIRDSRPPIVKDDTIRMMQLCDLETDKVMGVMLNYGNHPETLGSRNNLITADFCHYWLEGIENGIVYNGETKRDGVGGIAVFANGAVGGLMTTLGCNVYDPWTDKHYKEGSFEKARAQGYRLADAVLDKMASDDWQVVKEPAMKLRAKTFLVQVDNDIFKLAGVLGVLNRGFIKFKYLRSEVNLLSIGPVWIATVPGEINPEIVNGGIELPENRDLETGIVETPPIRELMQGDMNFVIGLGNDELGYMMPKSHWDAKEPYTYGEKKHYGEINSLGPNTAPTVYKEVKGLIDTF